MNITPALAKFLKALGLVVIAAVVSFLTVAANLDGVLPPFLVTIVTLIASDIESTIKRASGKALFGAARVR